MHLRVLRVFQHLGDYRYSRSAAEWGQLSPAAIRVLPITNAWDTVPSVQPACGPGAFLADYYLQVW